MPDGLDELGDLQRLVLDLIWEQDELTVAEARDQLAADGRELAYTTVLSVIQKLEKRGWLEHRRDGRTHVYRAVRTRSEAGRGTVRRVVERLFGGSTSEVMQHLVSDERLTAGDLADLRAHIDARIVALRDDGAGDPGVARPSVPAHGADGDAP
jgi:predicted transcriptional regulator